ncbi:receptor-type tyrosine-protein phosphatase epsilon-like [Saccostrea echinata]|uniref:receptor-type tyrosine-protein phosphatase epsilon-like n=1 Tax=Saccostrea echinata TaxID=191078 RepID=UPI002A841D68|nr:receptor-type tyrosine-protein phosphatase epsilon-like [Saccostrea echinata]
MIQQLDGGSETTINFFYQKLVLYRIIYPVEGQLVDSRTTTARQSSTLNNYDADRTIDGYPSRLSMNSRSCSHTGEGQSEAWLRIDLRKVYNIKSVKFWYRTDRSNFLENTERLHGYSLRYSTDKWNICYQDRTPVNQAIPMPSTVECPHKTRYLLFYTVTPAVNDKEQVFLEICEIEVYGCEINQYGENCTDCVDRCVSCHIIYGCVQCQPRFTGKYCEDCEPGFFGQSCDPCARGWYGSNCSMQCSGNCYNDETCHNVNGGCLNGCKPGYRGDRCSQQCENETYGLNCQNKCSGHCFEKEICDNVDGNCTKGCEKGWEGSQCSNVCPDGSFGPACSSQCGNCENETCHHVTGLCPGKCKEGWKGDKCLQVFALITEDPRDTPLSMFVVTGAVVGVMVALVLIVVVIVIRVRKGQQHLGKPNTKQHQKLEDLMNMDTLTDKLSPAEETQKIDVAEESTYYNIETTTRSKVDTSGDIIIAELGNVIVLKIKKECSEFKKEYEAIPYGEEAHIPCTVGKRPENKPKNRFKTTFPYDHSRIVLRCTESDYINANYIKNMKEERAYIASQGPKPNTVACHWMMIWQENVSVIVMLTNLIEGIKKKCEKYWPDLDMEMVSGKIELQLLQEKVYANYVVRRLKVNNSELKSSCTRIVTQFHYTQWPDHGVPDPLSLAVFQKHVRGIQNEHKNNPLLVHCSAGIGRTGTFIALDALYQHGLETGTVNIQKYVKMMRKDRMSMIQNCEQYIELYNALLESFKGGSYVISKDSLMNDVRELSKSDGSVLTRIQSEFEKLQSIKKFYSVDDKKEGSKYKELNMTRNILPVDKYRAILMSNVLGRGNYYNAVFLSTFTDRDMLIAGQYPLSGNSVDLIRLLLDHESSIVVFVNRLSDVPSSSEWFSEKTTTLHPYEIIKKDTSNVTQTIRIHDLKIRHLEEDTWHAIHLFEIMSWRIIDALPSDVNTLSDVVRHIQMDVASQSTKTPITILSKDGATGCGVLCGVYNAVQQLQQDDEVDMFSIVRQLQIRRPEMISTLEEYQFCFRAASNILSENSSDVYSNAESVYANT